MKRHLRLWLLLLGAAFIVSCDKAGEIDYEAEAAKAAAETTRVSDSAPITFSIRDRPELLNYNTTYRAIYTPMDKKITEIVKIEADHYNLYFYFKLEGWRFDAKTGILTFSIPEFNAVFDYIFVIYYRVEGSDEVQKTTMFVSNFR